MKIVILERNSVGTDVSVDALGKYGELTIHRNTTAHDVAERVKDADIIIANKAPLNEATLKDAPNVKLICEFATGYDNVDLNYCKQRGIKVANVVNYSTDAVAQHTFALCFYILEKLRHYDDYVKSGEYAAQDRFSNFDLPYTELAGKIWGIIGMGNIGKKVAQIATAFGCKVIFYSVTEKSSCTDYERVDFDTLLQTSDIISVHAPLTEQTKHLFTYDAFTKMKSSAYLINVGRGPIVKEGDLCRALNENLIAGAGLDVLEKEPMSADNPLLTIKDSRKLLITPHIAWATTEARTRLMKNVYKNIAENI